MAVRKAAQQDRSDAGKATNDVVERKAVALAEQIGWFLGTVRAKADGWLESDKLRREVARIRDGAAVLLQHVDGASRSARLGRTRPQAAAKPVVVAPPRASRGLVDAPGKRHRKPPPQEAIDKRMGEPVGKKMGQKNFKMGTGRGRS